MTSARPRPGGGGFTVILLIDELTFGPGSLCDEHVRVGVLNGSVLATAVLRNRNRAYRGAWKRTKPTPTAPASQMFTSPSETTAARGNTFSPLQLWPLSQSWAHSVHSNEPAQLRPGRSKTGRRGTSLGGRLSNCSTASCNCNVECGHSPGSRRFASRAGFVARELGSSPEGKSDTRPA